MYRKETDFESAEHAVRSKLKKYGGWKNKWANTLTGLLSFDIVLVPIFDPGRRQ
jgi:hypothetical protein